MGNNDAPINVTTNVSMDTTKIGHVYVLNPPVTVKPERFVQTQKPESLTCPIPIPPERQAIAIQTGCTATLAAIVDIIVMDVIPATVPEPCATRKINPMKYAKRRTVITEPLPILIVSISALPMFVLLITLPKAPPAPVIARATPAALRASFPAVSAFLSPI